MRSIAKGNRLNASVLGQLTAGDDDQPGNEDAQQEQGDDGDSDDEQQGDDGDDDNGNFCSINHLPYSGSFKN